MAEENAEISGFLDVKYLGGKYKVHKVRKRTLAPWKVWERHWCSIKKLGPGLGVKVQLDYGISNGGTTSPNGRDNSVIIPSDAIICRTQSRSKQFAFGIFPVKERKPLLYLAGNSETESQRWIANIRQLLRPRRHLFVPGSHSISVIDNVHSKASGLTGLYGDLIASTIGIFVKDVYTGEVIQNLQWQEVNHFHLITVGRPEDVKCICVIHTTKEFCGGVGELHIFCLEASRLLQDLVTQGRGPKNKINRRPLSLSEGDLRISIREELPRKISKNRDSNIANEDISSKIHSKMTENVYQPEPASVPNISDNLDVPNFPYNRRISDISIASGIYEEIADEMDSSKATTSHFYMDRLFYNHQSEEPPPLPPRQRCASESMKGTRSQDILICERNIMSVTSTRSSVLGEGNAFAIEKIMDTCNYVPMSPRLKDITLHQLQTQASLQENDYVIMR